MRVAVLRECAAGERRVALVPESVARLVKGGHDVRVEQGYEIGRPSLLLLRAAERGGRIEIDVGGRSIIVARGRFA